ncbi:hypothetical protein WA026_021359 [Henosepilachna vigintioctopunctata]|uniref:HNH homing endonuclease n=1 Tax=Henosepilachna vigintioctopunctata TaxID=420089 RepID=A0AAW1TXI7_9CUCU
MDYFWGNVHQNKSRHELFWGKFDYTRNKNLCDYAMNVYNMSKHLEPVIPEESIIKCLSKHFGKEVENHILYNQINNLDVFMEYLLEIEGNLRTNNGRGNNNFNDNYNRNNKYINQNRGYNNRRYGNNNYEQGTLRNQEKWKEISMENNQKSEGKRYLNMACQQEMDFQQPSTSKQSEMTQNF